MTQQPINAASLRGAVDLSSLAKTPAAGGAGAPGPSSGGGNAASTSAAVVEVTDQQQFGNLVNASVRYPVLIALYATSQAGTKQQVDELATAVAAAGGRVQLGTVDIDVLPEVGQAFQQLSQQVAQQGQLPAGAMITTWGFLQGQPVMPVPPLRDAAEAAQVVDELAKAGVQNGIAGRVPGVEESPESDEADAADAAEEEDLPPLHQEAFDAIERGDLDAAAAAYEKAIAADPQDSDAKLGLGQVQLMARTADVDPSAARAAAAANPTDVAAQLTAADLDVLGGHVEDAFSRLIDLVKATTDDERTAAREHLIGLFDLVGTSDPRVKKARTALMSALY
ncbi:co-chaperone YbbN [Dermacoccaceae bacterium W4C1]